MEKEPGKKIAPIGDRLTLFALHQWLEPIVEEIKLERGVLDHDPFGDGLALGFDERDGYIEQDGAIIYEFPKKIQRPPDAA